MKEQLEKIKDYLLKVNSNLEAIILFGSYARETQTEESDIDIAIKLRKKDAKR